MNIEPTNEKGGFDKTSGSVLRYFAAIAALGLIGVAWAILWVGVYTRYRVDIAWVNFLVGIGMGLTVRKVWGIGGFVAVFTCTLIMFASFGLGHVMLYMHYALAQQSADDIGIAPSFRSVMAHFGTLHWVLSATALFGTVAVPMRDSEHPDA